MADSDGTSPTSAQLLRATPAPEDSGAATADRYDWQAAMATVDLLAAYLDALDETGTVRAGATFELVCEHHEDWALVTGDDAVLVSAKHREVDQSTFSTFRALLEEGGVHHLLQRWLVLQQAPRCRLVTTTGLSKQCRTLMTAAGALAGGLILEAPLVETLDKFERAVEAARLKTALVEAERTPALAIPRQLLEDFLGHLQVEEGRPRRDHVIFTAAKAYAAPVAARLGSSPRKWCATFAA